MVEISTPGNSTSIVVPDTLAVIVHVNDDRVVETVRISLADENGVPIAPTVIVNVGQASATIERELVVSNELITSGTYSLQVQASDGTNSTSAFRSVYVTATPLRLRAIFVVPPVSGPITRIDSAGNQSTFSSVQNVSSAAINSYGQQLYLATGDNAPLQILAASSAGTGWQLTNQNAVTGPYFTDVRTDEADQRTYISSNEGLIRGYRGSSAPSFNAQAIPNHRPFSNVVIGDRFISEQRAIGLTEKKLVSYAHSSGIVLETFPLDLEIAQMYMHSDQQALVFGNRDGQGVIQLRNIWQGGNFEMRVFSEGEIITVDRLSPTTYVVALPGRVLRFNYSSNSTFTLLELTVSDVVFDNATGAIYAGAGQQLLVIDPNTGMTTNTIDLPTEIGRILPLLNR